MIHDECGREVLVQQIRESEGHCPWDGKPFTRDHPATLAQALGTAENAGSVLKTALEQIAGMRPALTFVRDSVIEPLEERAGRLAEGKKAPRR